MVKLLQIWIDKEGIFIWTFTELLLVILGCLIIIEKVYSQRYEAQVPRLGYLEVPEVWSHLW